MASRLNPIRDQGVGLSLTIHVWKEGLAYVAYAPELDVSSCGNSATRAKAALREAVSLFLEDAAAQGTLEDILSEAGFERRGKSFRPRRILAKEKLQLAIPAA